VLCPKVVETVPVNKARPNMMLKSFFINSQCREAGEDGMRLALSFFELLQNG